MNFFDSDWELWANKLKCNRKKSKRCANTGTQKHTIEKTKLKSETYMLTIFCRGMKNSYTKGKIDEKIHRKTNEEMNGLCDKGNACGRSGLDIDS